MFAVCAVWLCFKIVLLIPYVLVCRLKLDLFHFLMQDLNAISIPIYIYQFKFTENIYKWHAQDSIRSLTLL